MTSSAVIAIPAMIPFLDLRQSIEDTRTELDAAFARVLTSGSLIFGPELEAFEREFAAFCEVDHAIGVGNGLDAMTLILMALGLGTGDEVIVPGNTHIATWLAVSAVGARPVPVEPCVQTHNIDTGCVENAITSRTAAILPVHLYGQSADMTELRRIAERHGLALVVDAAQAAGAKFLGRTGNTIGDAAAFSFYPTKNMGALGDGGAIVTPDASLAEKIRKLRNYGGIAKNYHELKGINSRLGEIQAGILRSRLQRLENWNRRRSTLAHRYLARLSGQALLAMPQVIPPAQPVWHLFTIRVLQGNRERLRRFLEAAGIGSGIYYPVPPHLSPAYESERPGFAPLPLTEALAGSVLSLPLHPHLTESDVDRVSDSILEWLHTPA